MPEPLTGRCLCGAVTFEIDRLSEGPVACHCRECQRQSGSAFWTAVTAAREAVRIAGERLGWVRLTQNAWRGFCRDCGGYLFWQPVQGDTLDIAAGAIDGIDGMKIEAHIFTAEARLPLPEDGAPRFPHGRKGID
ncbi:GFA family protein [Limibaculum sp. FT325]|uniref:GFA family protein n=1 Tax=Thermohalobaculum sediminis TaxID=2939436 RepID=UPI0020C0ACF7|nr:GFA family protein [Limibaculum sediminis]MCL5778039.1 GFA family protein [Limibaculum sediminis]